MDITSFLLGYESGAVDLQEKTATPGTSDIEVLPDDGYGGLSKVTVEGDSNLLPENILSGVDIFGVSGTAETSGGGGGGSLPAGVYWEQVVPMTPKSIQNYFFTYKGKLHLLSRQSSSSDVYDIYEFSNGVYSIVASNLTIMYEASGVREYNEKIHFVGGGNAYHYVLNGSTVTQLNKLPAAVLNRSLFEWNGILYAHDTASGVLYQWNESDDTWTDSGIIKPVSYASGTMFVYNNELYRLDSKKLYKYVDGEGVVVKTFDVFTSVSHLNGDNLYFTTSSSGFSIVYKYNMGTETLKEIGATPYYGGNAYWYSYDGTVRLAGGNSTWRNNLILHEVEASE